MTPAEEYEFNKWLITLPPPVQVNILEACERGESYTKAAWSAAVAAERERCARVCEEPEPECCNRPIMRSNGEIDGCCGSPDPRPKTAEECAAAIRRG